MESPPACARNIPAPDCMLVTMDEWRGGSLFKGRLLERISLHPRLQTHLQTK